MNADMRPAAAVWHEVFYPVNVEAFERQMATFDRMREIQHNQEHDHDVHERVRDR